jgi:hypothetical protein
VCELLVEYNLRRISTSYHHQQPATHNSKQQQTYLFAIGTNTKVNITKGSSSDAFGNAVFLFQRKEKKGKVGEEEETVRIISSRSFVIRERAELSLKLSPFSILNS